MKKTLTLDDDIHARLEEIAERSGKSLSSLVNLALRAGLNQMDRQHKATAGRRYHTRSVSLGRSLIGPIVNVYDAIARVEGEDYR